MGRFSVPPSVCTYVHTSPPLGHPARPEAQPASQPSLRLQGMAQKGEWTDGRTDGWMDGWTDGRTDRRTAQASYRVACPQLKSAKLRVTLDCAFDATTFSKLAHNSKHRFSSWPHSITGLRSRESLQTDARHSFNEEQSSRRPKTKY